MTAVQKATIAPSRQERQRLALPGSPKEDTECGRDRSSREIIWETLVLTFAHLGRCTAREGEAHQARGHRHARLTQGADEAHHPADIVDEIRDQEAPHLMQSQVARGDYSHASALRTAPTVRHRFSRRLLSALDSRIDVRGPSSSLVVHPWVHSPSTLLTQGGVRMHLLIALSHIPHLRSWEELERVGEDDCEGDDAVYADPVRATKFVLEEGDHTPRAELRISQRHAGADDKE